MTKMLASVTGLGGGGNRLPGGADIVDLKDPTDGALGAVATEDHRTGRDSIAGRRPDSAVCGDLPMEPEAIRAKAEEIAATGVDYVKIGFFPSRNAAACAEALTPLAAHNEADSRAVCRQRTGFRNCCRCLARHGFHGVMVDTADKSEGPLARPYAAGREFRHFVQARQGARPDGGSGRIARSAGHSKAVAAYNPDFLGFRGALCAGGGARRSIDAERGGADTRADPGRAAGPLRAASTIDCWRRAAILPAARSGARNGQDLRPRFRAAGADRRLQFRARPHPEGALRRHRRRAAGDPEPGGHAPRVLLRHHHGRHPRHRRARPCRARARRWPNRWPRMSWRIRVSCGSRCGSKSWSSGPAASASRSSARAPRKSRRQSDPARSRATRSGSRPRQEGRHLVRPAVVKLGGSTARQAEMGAWIAALAACQPADRHRAGRRAVRRSGARRAEARSAFPTLQRTRWRSWPWTSSPRSFSTVMNGWCPRARWTRSSTLQQVGKVPVWLPSAMAIAAPDIPACWDVTSDSLAAWLAGKLGRRGAAADQADRCIHRRRRRCDSLTAQGHRRCRHLPPCCRAGVELHRCRPARCSCGSAGLARLGRLAGKRIAHDRASHGGRANRMAKLHTPRWAWA